MNHGIALGAAADGSPVIIKSGRRERATRLRREAAVLHAARHPRVVEVISLVDEDDAIELALAQVPGRTLLDHPPLSAPDLATLFASLAATVADLHQVGVTHGNLGAEHLILDRDSRPTICGFGNGVVWEDESDDRRRAESIDTISMGRLLDHELTRSIDDVVIDDREPTVIALRHIADLADSASTSHLVTASQIARRLGELTDANATDARAFRHSAPSRLTRWSDGLDGMRHVAVGLATSVAIVIGAWLTWDAVSGGSGGAERASASIPTAPVPPAATSSPVTNTTSSTPVSPVPTLLVDAASACEPLDTATDVRRADVDGDGCPEAWSHAAGVLSVGPERYALGAPGDLVLLGDWNCDGTASPALVDRTTGVAHLFERWPSRGGTIQATSSVVVGEVITAETITTETARGSTCDVLEVATSAGTERVELRS